MQSAAEVDEPIRAAGQRSEHVGREDVHGQSLRVTVGGCGAGRLEVDAGIVDNSVHPADLVHLAARSRVSAALLRSPMTTPAASEVAERRRPLAGAGVEDNVMAFTDEDTGGGAADPSAEPVMKYGAGIILPPAACWCPQAAPCKSQRQHRHPGGEHSGAGAVEPSQGDAAGRHPGVVRCRLQFPARLLQDRVTAPTRPPGPGIGAGTGPADTDLGEVSTRAGVPVTGSLQTAGAKSRRSVARLGRSERSAVPHPNMLFCAPVVCQRS